MRHFFPTSPSAPACSGGKTTPPVVPSDSQQPPPSPPADPPLPEPPLTTAQLQQTKAELEGLLARVDELLAKRAALEASPVTVQTTAVTPPPAVDVGKKTKRAVASAAVQSTLTFRLPTRRRGSGTSPATEPASHYRLRLRPRLQETTGTWKKEHFPASELFVSSVFGVTRPSSRPRLPPPPPPPTMTATVDVRSPPRRRRAPSVVVAGTLLGTHAHTLVGLRGAAVLVLVVV